MRPPRVVQTRLENTHGTEFRELLYRWHPWFGLRVGVHEAIKRSGEVVFRCSLSGTDVDRWLEIPSWMFERSACAWVRVAADTHADLAALMALAELVRDALSDRFAPSNACFRAHPVSLATRIGERYMPRQTKQTQARRRLPQQIDLFAGEPRTTTGDMPTWSGLPTETQAANQPDDTVDPDRANLMTEAGHEL